MREGISGILKPNGEFIPCEYSKHNTITDKISKEEEYKLALQKKQYEWLMKHSNELDEG